MPVVLALWKQMSQLHQCKNNKRSKSCFLNIKYFLCIVILLLYVPDSCRLCYYWIPGLRKIPNSIRLCIKVDLIITWFKCNGFLFNGWRWSLVSTSKQTSFSGCAMKSWSSFYLMWLYLPFAQWKACARVKFPKYVLNERIFTGSQKSQGQCHHEAWVWLGLNHIVWKTKPSTSFMPLFHKLSQERNSFHFCCNFSIWNQAFFFLYHSTVAVAFVQFLAVIGIKDIKRNLVYEFLKRSSISMMFRPPSFIGNKNILVFVIACATF